MVGADGGLLMSLLPVVEEFLVQVLDRATQRPQALAGEFVEMLLRPRHNVIAALLKPLVDYVVGALAVQSQLAVLPQYHRHSLSHVVEVEDAQQLVDLTFAHRVDGDGVWRSLAKDKAKVARRRDQGRFVGRLSLILHPAVLLVCHHRVTHRQQSKERVHVLVVATHRVEERLVVELELRLVVLVEGEIQWRCGLK